MIQLRFNTMAGTDPSIVGPAPFFRIDGLLLRQGPEGQVVGRYHDHHWEVHGSFASSYECTDRISVCFEDGGGRVTKRYGPFQQLLFPNGCCYADQSLFAELAEETEQWIHRADRSKWRVLVIRPAD